MSSKDENCVITVRYSLSQMKCPHCGTINRLSLVTDDPMILWCIACKTRFGIIIATAELKED